MAAQAVTGGLVNLGPTIYFRYPSLSILSSVLLSYFLHILRAVKLM
jgi:hypothetical protein